MRRTKAPRRRKKRTTNWRTQKHVGRLSKLEVLLHRQLYPVFKVEDTARVFEASVNFGVGWQDAFVVSGELADFD